MQQSVLYVCEQGTSLHKSGESVVVRKDGAELLEVESFRLGTVCLVGAVQCSTQAMAALLAEGIDVSLLGFGGRFVGRISGPCSKNVPLRLRQYALFAEEEARDEFARSIVAAKLAGQRELLLRYQKHHPDVEIATAIGQIRETEAKLEGAGRESLRGHEGSAARAFFQAVRTILPPDFEFEGRNRRPPRDPVNAMLSFAYTVAGNELTAFVEACGLEPHLGLWHEVEYGRSSLALDLLEAFRPDIDAFVIRMFNRKIFSPADFRTDESEGCRFGDQALKRFFVEYEKEMRGHEPGLADPEGRMTGLRGEMAGVVEAFAGWLRGREAGMAGVPPVEVGSVAGPGWAGEEAVTVESTAKGGFPILEARHVCRDRIRHRQGQDAVPGGEDS